VEAFVIEAHGIAREHGWWDDAPTWQDDPNLRRQVIGNKLMLIVSEAGEANDALAANDTAEFAEELADILIRGADLAGFLGIALWPNLFVATAPMPRGSRLLKPRTMKLLAAVTGRLARAEEALRHDDDRGFADHLSGAMVATAALAGVWGIDLPAEIRRKTEINRARPYKHGKQFWRVPRIRAGRGEVPPHQILVCSRLRVVAPLAPVTDAGDPGRPHQPGDPFAPTPDAQPQAQLGVHPRGAVGATGLFVHRGDGRGQLGVRYGPDRRLPADGLVVGRTRQVQHPAGHRDRKVVGGQLLDQRDHCFGRTFSLAK
jgi:hypothetical protein